MRYRITTLGCRVNHAEARELESVLRDRGLVPAVDAEPADLEVVHTCSVTNAAGAKSRQAVRRARRRLYHTGLPEIVDGRELPTRHAETGGPRRSHPRNPRNPRNLRNSPRSHAGPPKIILTGCYGTTDAADAARLVGDSADVLPPDGGPALAERFAQRVDQWLAGRQAQSSLRSPAPGSFPQTAHRLPPAAPPRAPAGHVRAELKVQDGCDAHCTFCIIPSVRRTLRSKPVADAAAEARRLVDLGHREIVLTGIFLGAYGRETALRRRQARPDATPLADLLDAVANTPGLERLRLSSLEPGDVNEPLLDAMVANQPVVVPHLHLPLQSGSDAVLRRMNRQYRCGDYLEMIDRVNDALATPDGLPPAITTDVICGFPGETERDFERTAAVARRVGYLHMHLFPFSPRRGTAAARWRDRFVDHHTVRRRVRRLHALEHDPVDGLSIRYRRRLLGRTVRVILEQPDPDQPGIMTGRCDHYAPVRVPTRRPRGALVTAEITTVTAQAMLAGPARSTVSLPLAS